MILQSLNRYYERQRANGKLLPEGFELKEIPFVVVLDAKGAFVQIDDTRSGDGKKRRAHAFEVPQGEKKTSAVTANLLWDTAEYALGIDTRGNPERVARQHEAFKARIIELGAAGGDAGLRALQRFLEALDLSQLEQDANWTDIRETNPLVSFRLSDDAGELICQRPAIVEALSAPANVDEGTQGFCPVRGEADAIARLHPAIKNVWGAQSSGANIVSFNLPAFNSYGKEQGANAPVGRRAAFNYTSALNHLLRKDSPQRMQVGGTSTVFWAAEDTTFVDTFAAAFGWSTREDDPDRGIDAVRALYASIRNGAYAGDDRDTPFHVLGLAPNAARIAVRFWHTAPIAEVAQAMLRHFDDIEIERPSFEPEHLPLFRLLVSVATLNKADNIPPTLDGDVMRAILTQRPYPALLLQAAVRRCRTERQITYPRAAVLKASLNRLIRTGRLAGKELSVTLDPANNAPAYRLGRLFSTLERIQAVAQPGINATIRDRYYGAASSTPASVFPTLVKLKNHHLSKISGKKPGLSVWFENLLTEIFGGLQSFPSRLSLPEQGLFAIGYYHQQQQFFAGKNADGESTDHDDATKD